MRHVEVVHPHVPLVGFVEPNLNDELTAIALLPYNDGDCPLTWLKDLPLCLKDKQDPRWKRESQLRASKREGVTND